MAPSQKNAKRACFYLACQCSACVSRVQVAERNVAAWVAERRPQGHKKKN